ncbi:uncharacterized protein LY79DRAFT_563646 [Colletotrichum navitas]|uniref:Secreted protein n=1 Tax=Colletotrichum navitas TaxID=681940 RepID=A0AAD8PTA8_9PEZI|nr:uncharacterized protein LY79DRAFT_563646 [Colletotrichum navitas]KAK1579704.1 hypothetical protein LY79DRAFT_563646 [Colletotrichum navitas]
MLGCFALALVASHLWICACIDIMVECCPRVELYGTALFQGSPMAELSTSIIGRIGLTPQTPCGSVILSFGPVYATCEARLGQLSTWRTYCDSRRCGCSVPPIQ